MIKEEVAPLPPLASLIRRTARAGIYRERTGQQPAHISTLEAACCECVSACESLQRLVPMLPLTSPFAKNVHDLIMTVGTIETALHQFVDRELLEEMPGKKREAGGRLQDAVERAHGSLKPTVKASLLAGGIASVLHLFSLTLAQLNVTVMVMLGSLYVLVYFQAEEDKNTAIAPKIAVVLGLSLSCLLVLTLPLDVANRSTASGMDMETLWQVEYMLVAIMAVGVVPFLIFFYEAEDPESRQCQWWTACKYEALTVGVCVAFVLLGWLLWGYAEVPVVDYTYNGMLLDATTEAICPAEECPDVSIGRIHQVLKVSVTPVTWIMALIAFVGWFLFVLFGGKPEPEPKPGPSPNPSPDPNSSPNPSLNPSPSPNPNPNPSSNPNPNPSSDPRPRPSPSPDPDPDPNLNRHRHGRAADGPARRLQPAPRRHRPTGVRQAEDGPHPCSLLLPLTCDPASPPPHTCHSPFRYAKQKMALNQRALQLLDIAKVIGPEGHRATSRKGRVQYNKFVQAVYSIEKD